MCIRDRNGTAVENGTMDVDIPAGSSKEVVIPFTTPTDAAAGDEYFLNISFVTKSDDQFTWAKKDFAVAEAQFELDFAGTDAAVEAMDTSKLEDIKTFEETDGEVKAVSYTHLRAHETDSYLVCRLLLEKKKKTS